MSKEIMQQALEALEMHVLGFDGVRKMELAIEALEAALAQPDETETLKRCLYQMQEAAKSLAQPEPVALNKNMTLGCPAYLHGLAQPEQEPVNTMPTKIVGPNLEQILNAAGFYRHKWVGLTDKERNEMIGRIQHDQYTRQRDLIGKTQIITEMYLKEKNNAV